MSIPVTVLTGFLGSGKTTLLNQLLRGGHGRRLGVIVNEFGEAGIDGELLASAGEELIELSNGCVCCTVRGDLMRTLHGLRARADLDGIVIETTGLADPAPVAQTFLFDEALRRDFPLDGIVAVADVLHIRDQLRENPEAAEQVAFADLLVLSKTDLADPAELPAIRTALARANPGARIEEARTLLPVAILGLGGYDLARVENHVHDHATHHHTKDIVSVMLTAEEPLDEERVTEWLTSHLAQHGRDVLRTKGILDVAGEARKLVLQGVRMILEADLLDPWPPGPRRSRLVMIGRHLDGPALQRTFRDCIA